MPPAIVSFAEPVAIGDTPGARPPAIINVTELAAVADALSVVPPDRPPTADAGPDQTVATGATVTLDASGSSDPDAATTLLFFWSLLSQPAGSTAVVSNEGVVNPTFVAGRPGDYVAQLIVGDGVFLSAPDTVTVTVRDGADLRILFLAPPAAPPVGSFVSFHVQVINAGPATASNVTARLRLPAGYTFVGGSPLQGSYDGTTGDWTIGPMGPGFQADLDVSATVNASGPYDLTATITGSSEPDPVGANNTATATVTPDPNADLRISFLAPPTAPPVGSFVSFHVQVINAGPATARNVVARLQLPAGYTFVGGSPLQGSYNGTTGDWTIGPMGSGFQADLDVSATVNASGPYDLTATITGSSQPDPNPANNTATVTVTPNATASIAETPRRIP